MKGAPAYIDSRLRGLARYNTRRNKRIQRRRFKCTALLGPLVTSLPSPATGWLIAGSILTAIRLGRKQAEDERAHKIQREAWQPLEEEQQSLLQRRARERSRSQEIAEIASRRIEEAQAKAQEEEAARRAENARLKLVIDKQKQKAEEARRAEQEAYEQQEAQLKAELEARTAEERKIRAQKEDERRLKEAERRRQEEEKRRQQEQDRLDRQAEQKRLEQLELERKAEERRQIKKLSKTFALTLDASAKLDIPSQACEKQLAYQLAHGAYLGAERFASNARLQNMIGEGPLQSMTEAELVHWMRSAAVRASRRLLDPTRRVLKEFGKRRQALQEQLQAKTTKSVLPEADQRRTSTILCDAIKLVEADNPDKAREKLEHLMEEEEITMSEDLGQAEIPNHVAASLVLALFLDEMWNERPAKRVEASPWYESAANLSSKILTDRCAQAPKDSLQEVSQIISAVLPEDHVIGQAVARIAEGNLSDKTRRSLREQEELIQAEIAERLVEFEWPDKSELSAAKLKEIEASVPIPERVWALKNVGATQAMSGPEGRARARQLLERAVGLKRELVGSAKHPGMLPEYEALAGLLDREPEWERDAAALRLRMLSILSSIAEGFVQSGDTTSAVILLEASIRKIEGTVDPKQQDLGTATKRANQLFATLSDQEKDKVKASRQKSDVLKKVISTFEEELAARQVTGQLLQFERWNEEGVRLLSKVLQ